MSKTELKRVITETPELTKVISKSSDDQIKDQNTVDSTPFNQKQNCFQELIQHHSIYEKINLDVSIHQNQPNKVEKNQDSDMTIQAKNKYRNYITKTKEAVQTEEKPLDKLCVSDRTDKEAILHFIRKF